MKRLICCLDGTWNDDKEGSVLTNVAKLHRSLLPRDQNNVEQLAHYVTGIATAYEGRTQFVLGAIGFEVEDRVKAAYGFFVENYDAGDEIVLFGFSRGAFEARSLGGFIALVGIAKRGAGFSLDEAWALYRRPPGRRDEGRLAALRAAAHFPVRIKCIGVWDTVGNLGNPFFQGPWTGRRHGFHDLSLNDSIDVALQGLSIDEVRGPFRPTLWSVAEGTSLPAHQHVEQVWFAGTHADVGGGWPETALSDIALLWMAERANETAGLGFNMDWLRQTTTPNPMGVQHSVTCEGIYRLSALCPFIRLIGQCLDGIPKLRRLFLGSWRTSRLPRGQVSVNERVHESALSRLGETVPELRGTARRDIVYQPQNLVGFVEVSRSGPGSGPSSGLMSHTGDAAPPPPRLVTIHGTGAGSVTDQGEGWWQRQSPFLGTLAKVLDLDASRIGVVPFHWDVGANSEEARRKGGMALYEKLKTYDEAGVDYHLIGHSHGGSVIYSALIHSVARGSPLTRLRSWCTVGTPFLDYRPNRWLFTRLSMIGLSLYVLAAACLVFAVGLVVAYAFGAKILHALSLASLPVLILVVVLLLLYAGACFAVLLAIDRLRGGWRTDKQKREVRRLYEDRWLGIWHKDDEAISALANVKSLKGEIVSTKFLVPIFAMIPLLYTIMLIVSFFVFATSLAINPPDWARNVKSTIEQSIGEGAAAKKEDPRPAEPSRTEPQTDTPPVEPAPARRSPPEAAAPATRQRDGGDTATDGPRRGETTETKPAASPSRPRMPVWLMIILVPVALVAGVTALFVLVTAISIFCFKLLGRVLGWPLARLIDKLVWSSVRQQAWGDDKTKEGVASVSSHPPLFAPRYAPLPDTVGDKLSEFSDKQAITTLKKVRAILGMAASPQQSADIRADLTHTLNWRELIHTSYFDIPECVRLIALGLHRAGLCGLCRDEWPDAAASECDGWMQSVCTPPKSASG